MKDAANTKIRKILSAKDGSLSLAIDTFKGVDSQLNKKFNQFLKTYYAGQPILIRNVTPDGTTGLRVSGTTFLFDQSDVHVTVNAHIDTQDQQENILILFKYTLRDSTQPKQKAIFSRMFKNLPYSLNIFKDMNKQTPALDDLIFSEAYVYASTDERTVKTERGDEVPVHQGFTFAGYMTPSGAMGVLESFLTAGHELLLSGPINGNNDVNTVFPPLPPDTYPWETTDVPGINLKAQFPVSIPSLGSLQLQNVYMQIYSPFQERVVRKNPGYQPLVGCTGDLLIKSAHQTLHLNAIISPGIGRLRLSGTFDNLVLSDFSALKDFVGDDDLAACLTPIGFGSTAKKDKGNHANLTLQDIYIDMVYSDKGVSVEGVSCSLEIPHVTWQVFKNNDRFSIGLTSIRFMVMNPFASQKGQRHVDVLIYGDMELFGVPFEVAVGPDFYVSASLKSNQTIPFSTFMSEYLPNLDMPQGHGADLTIQGATVSISPKKYYSFYLEMAKSDEWVIDACFEKIHISNLSCNVMYTVVDGKSGALSGALQGNLRIGDVDMQMQYNIPGDFRIQSMLPETSFSKITQTLSNHNLDLPSAFELELKQISVLLEKNQEGFSLALGTQIDHIGSFQIQTLKAPSGWGFACGISLGPEAFDHIAGLKNLSLFNEKMHIDDLLLVISTIDEPHFSFPEKAAFNAPHITDQVSLPAGKDLVAGFNFYGALRMGKSLQEQLIKSFLKVPDGLEITLQVGKYPDDPSKLFIQIEDKLNQNTTMRCKFGGMVVRQEFDFFLSGTFATTLGDATREFDVNMVFLSEVGGYLSGGITGEPLYLSKDVYFSDLELAAFIPFEGDPAFGFAGTLGGVSFSSSIAMFYDPEKPQSPLLLGAVSNLSLKDIAAWLAPGKTPNAIGDALATCSLTGTGRFPVPDTYSDDFDHLKYKGIAEAFSKGNIQLTPSPQQVHVIRMDKGKQWGLTNLADQKHYEIIKKGNRLEISLEPQFYYYNNPMLMPLNIGTFSFSPGVRINGKISIFNWSAVADVDISLQKGISIDVEMDPITFSDVLAITSSEHPQNGPRLSLSTYAHDGKEPHFIATGDIKVLGVMGLGVDIQITSSGMIFDLNGQLKTPGKKPVINADFDLNAIISKSRFHIRGASHLLLNVTIDLGDLGMLPLVDFEFDADCQCDTARESYIKGDLELDVLGLAKVGPYHINIPLDGVVGPFAKIVSLVEEEVRNLASDIIDDVKQSYTQWKKYIDDGIVEATKDVDWVKKNVFHVDDDSDDEAATETLMMGCQATTVLMMMASSPFQQHGPKVNTDTYSNRLRAIRDDLNKSERGRTYVRLYNESSDSINYLVKNDEKVNQVVTETHAIELVHNVVHMTGDPKRQLDGGALAKTLGNLRTALTRSVYSPTWPEDKVDAKIVKNAINKAVHYLPQYAGLTYQEILKKISKQSPE